MKRRFNNLRWLPLYGLMPLLIGMGYVEVHLTLPAGGHMLIQILMVGIIFSLVFLWIRGNTGELMDHEEESASYLLTPESSWKMNLEQKAENYADVDWN